MAGKATIELALYEVEILCSAAVREWEKWGEHRHSGETYGWCDAKEMDRVLTREHQTGELVAKLREKLKAMFDDSERRDEQCEPTEG